MKQGALERGRGASGLLLCLLALALSLRILVPAGWMPAADGGLRIVPCIAAPQTQAMPAHHGPGHEKSPAPAANGDGPCSFFGLSSLFAAPALAVVIGAARRRGTPLLVAVWLGSAGMLYPLVAGAAVPAAPPPPGATCDRSQALAALGTMAPGVVIAPIDTGAWGIAATPHRFLAAPYHRNAAANLATFHFFLGGAGPAREIAKLWRTDYVLVCPNDLDPLSPAPGSLIRQLEAGRAPAWLRPLTAAQGSLLYRVVR